MTPEQRELFIISACVWNTIFAIYMVHTDNDSNSCCPNFRAGFLFVVGWVSGLFLLPFLAIGGALWGLGKLINGVKS